MKIPTLRRKPPQEPPAAGPQCTATGIRTHRRCQLPAVPGTGRCLIHPAGKDPRK